MDKETVEGIEEVNKKTIILLKAAANNKFIRFFCYLASINFILGIVMYFLFRNAEKKFAERCILISFIFLVLVFVVVSVNILLNL